MARLEWERASLGTLQVPPYDLSMVSSRRSSKDSFISYGGNRYSVPVAYALSLLTVREKPEGILDWLFRTSILASPCAALRSIPRESY